MASQIIAGSAWKAGHIGAESINKILEDSMPNTDTPHPVCWASPETCLLCGGIMWRYRDGRDYCQECDLVFEPKDRAGLAELADALDLGSSGATRAGSTPASRTTLGVPSGCAPPNPEEPANADERTTQACPQDPFTTE